MDDNLRKSIILEHYQNPINKGLVDKEGYYRINMNSESCIDDLDFMVKIEDGVIADARFDGEACAISTSASSVLINMIIGKKLDEVLNIIENYEAMIDEKPYDEELLGEANAYSGVAKQANRKKCALLPFIAIRQIIEKEEKSNERQKYEIK